MKPSFVTQPIAACLTVAGIALGLSSCHSSRSLTGTADRSRPEQEFKFKKTPTDQVSDIDDRVGTQLVQAALGWMGTPYTYGGESADGVDCSGLTRVVYQDIATIELPHNSAKQLQYCLSLNRDQLKPGDLVFFTNSKRDAIGHVGIYIGQGEMVHASSSRGVIASDIDTGYWKDYYVCGGRVPGVTVAAQVATPVPERSGPVQVVIGAGGARLEPVRQSVPAAQPTPVPASSPDPEPDTRAADIENKVKNAFQ